MKKIFTFYCLFGCISFLNAQVPFTAGSVVVFRIGDGVNPHDFHGQPVFLDEYATNGTLIRSIPMPTTVSGLNKRFILQGTGSSTAFTNQGALTVSQDGKYLGAVGFNASVGTDGTTLNQTTSRVIARVDYGGNVNTETELTNLAIGEGFAAVIHNTNIIYSCHTNVGEVYSTIGASTGSVVATFAGRIPRIVNNTLYISDGSGRVRSFPGLPAPPATSTSTALPGISTSAAGQCDYFFADLNPSIAGLDVVYVAHLGVNALRKYSYNGTTWVSDGQIGVDADDYFGITGYVTGTTVTLFVTRKTLTANSNGGYGELVTLTDATGHAGAFTGTPGIIVSAANQTSMRGVSVSPSNTPMPVRLLNFTANKSKHDALINWATSSETSFSHFELERSFDAISFEKISSIIPKPEASATKLYSYTDANVFNASTSVIYYRLKMVDKDGKYTYSSIVALKNNSKFVELLSAYPNPFDKEVFVKISLEQASKTSIYLTDMTGRRVGGMLQLQVPAGENTIALPGLEGLSRGVYLLRVEATGNMNTLKLIK